ncbi:MAG: hypothetical protein FWE05_07655 [Defluviitaleaceae bacterium]|nr:hypothetical protein [Defluviitaleaceae bacterium]
MKKLVGLFLFALLTLVMSVVVFAHTPYHENAEYENSVYDIIEQLNTLDFGREVSFEPIYFLPFSGEDDLLQFDTLDEFESFLRDFITLIESPEFANGDTMEYIGFVPFRFDRTETWWAGNPLTGLFMWRNIGYDILRNTITWTGNPTVGVRDSWLTGAYVGIQWTHRSATVSSDWAHVIGGAEAIVSGTWRVSASIGGVVSLPIGVTFNDEWHRILPI